MSYEESFPAHTATDSAGCRFLVAARVCVVEWSTTPQRGRPSFRSTHTQYNDAVGTRLRRVRSLPDKSPLQQGLSF
jgi:hypothetical protein